MGRRADASGAPPKKTGTIGGPAAGGEFGNEAARAEEPARGSRHAPGNTIDLQWKDAPRSKVMH